MKYVSKERPQEQPTGQDNTASRSTVEPSGDIRTPRYHTSGANRVLKTCFALSTLSICVITSGIFAADNPHAQSQQTPPRSDWLVTPCASPVELQQDSENAELVLTNGLIRRTFRTRPNFATVEFTNTMTGAAVIRGVKPEAIVERANRTYIGEFL